MKSKIRGMAVSAVIAAIYTVLTILPGLNLISYGAVQFRISEMLTVLPLFTPWAIPGLGIGCFVSNLLSTAGALDLIFGTGATLLAAGCTWHLRNKPKAVAVLPVIIINAVIIGWMITYFYTNAVQNFSEVLVFNMISVGIGQAGVCYILGLPLAVYIEKHRNIFKI